MMQQTNLYDIIMGADIEDEKKVYILQQVTSLAPQTSEPIQINIQKVNEKQKKKRQPRREIPSIYRCICKKSSENKQCSRRHPNIDLSLEELQRIVDTPAEHSKLCCKSHSSIEFTIFDDAIDTIKELDQDTFDHQAQDYKNRNKRKKDDDADQEEDDAKTDSKDNAKADNAKADAKTNSKDKAAQADDEEEVEKPKKKRVTFKSKLSDAMKDIENQHFVRGLNAEGEPDLPNMKSEDMSMKYFNHNHKHGICYDKSEKKFHFIDMSNGKHVEITTDKYEKVLKKLNNVFASSNDDAENSDE